MEEKHIWQGSPSQWINFGTFLICGLLCWLVLPIFLAIWKYLEVRTWDFKVTDQRIIIRKGVLSRTTDELELFRVKDIRQDEPFILRLVGLSNIQLRTSDRSHRVLTIPGLKNADELRERLRIEVEKRRETKRVRETDFE